MSKHMERSAQAGNVSPGGRLTEIHVTELNEADGPELLSTKQGDTDNCLEGKKPTAKG